MKRIIWTLSLSIIFFSSCSEYQKAMKSNSHEVKYKMADKLYKEQKYAKLIPLLEDIVYLYKGTDKGEDLLFRLATSYYKTGDYIIAGYYFRKFVATYPNSKNAEEAQFKSAYCYYLDAPRPTLDQSPTQKAIREFQIFLRKYPQSDKISECNKYMDELYLRLQTKSYTDAKLYFDLERYKASNIALKNSLEEYPDSPYREEIQFLLLKSHFLLAKNSVVFKQKERYEDAEKYFKIYVNEYPQGKFINQANKIHKDIDKKLKAFNKSI